MPSQCSPITGSHDDEPTGGFEALHVMLRKIITLQSSHESMHHRLEILSKTLKTMFTVVNVDASNSSFLPFLCDLVIYRWRYQATTKALAHRISICLKDRFGGLCTDAADGSNSPHNTVQSTTISKRES